MERFIYQLYIDEKVVVVAATIYESDTNLRQIAFIKENNIAYNDQLEQLEFNPLKDLVQSCLTKLKKKINVSEIKQIYLSYGFDSFKTSNQIAINENEQTKLAPNQLFEFNNLINAKHQIHYSLVDYGISYQEYKKNTNKQPTSIFNFNEINHKTYLSGYYIKNDDYHTLCQVFKSLKLNIARFHISKAHLITTTLAKKGTTLNKAQQLNEINFCLGFNQTNNNFKIYLNSSLVLDEIESNSELFNICKLTQIIVNQLQISKETIIKYLNNYTYNQNSIIKYVLNQKNIFSVNEMSSEIINKVIIKQLNMYLKTLFNQQTSIFKSLTKQNKINFYFYSEHYNFNMILKEAISNDELVRFDNNIKYKVFELENIFLADHFKDKYELIIQADLINIKLTENQCNQECVLLLHQQLQNNDSKEMNMNN